MTVNARMSGPGGEPSRVVSPRVGAIVGRFELLEILGEGRLGPLWRVRDMGTGTLYALRLLTEPPSDVLSRLETEVRAWRWIRQRNLVPVMEILDDASLIGVISPFVEGTPLSVVLQDGAAMDLSEAIPLFRAVLDALATAHAAERVHGALTPASLLLEIDEVRITPRLTDVGLAVALGLPVETAPERARYVAPEVGVDGVPTVAVDIFAAGVLLYEMVAGFPPFLDRPVVEGGRLDYVPLDEIVPECPAILARAVDTALSVHVPARFATAVAFKMALAPIDRWVADEPTQPAAVLDWGDPPPRTSVRARTLPPESSEGDDPPSVVPPSLRAAAAAVAPRVAPPVAAPPAPPAVPSAPPSPARGAPVVISLDASEVNDANPVLVNELKELNAAPSRSVRWASAIFRFLLGPAVLVIVLVGIQSFRAGRALSLARAEVAAARTQVDRDLASAAGHVERLAALGARREPIDAAFFSAIDEKELPARVEALRALRDALGSGVRTLPKLTRPEDLLAQRSLHKGIDALGANHDEALAATAALAAAEAMPLASFADRWGFAEEDPLVGVLSRVEGAVRGAP